MNRKLENGNRDLLAIASKLDLQDLIFTFFLDYNYEYGETELTDLPDEPI